MGAFAAGLVLSGNRLTHQIDALILPYRESFGVVFFVSLGMLLDPSILLDAAPLLIGGLQRVLFQHRVRRVILDLIFFFWKELQLPE